jgi:hypothetical protein
MKSVLIGADILKLGDGYKLLEINTDADFNLPDLEYADFQPFFDYLTQNSFEKFVIIYKKKHIAKEVLNLFESKCVENSIEFDKILVLDNSVTIPSFIEEPNTFYLRCAYDVTALVDDTYCRDKSEVVKLLFDSNNESILPKTYVKYTGDDSILDNLTDLVDNELSPNVIAKKILPDFDKIQYPAFYNIESANDLDTLKQSTADDVMLQEYEINTNLSEDGQITDIIRMTCVLLSDVETIIPLGISMTSNLLPLDTSLITYTDNKLDNKWKAMYFSNPNLVGYGVPNEYEVIKLVDGVEEIVPIDSIIIGDVIKAVNLPNLSTTASINESLDWSLDTSNFGSIEYTTASVLFTTSKTYEGWLTSVEFSDGIYSGSSILSNNEILLVSSSTTNDIRFKMAYDLNSNDSIITSTNKVLPVTNKENLWYSGSIVVLDIEPSDVFVAGTDMNEITKNSVGNVILHNKCIYSWWCCVAENTIIATEEGGKEIKDIKVGDLVWSYNFDTNESELKEVLQIQSPIHNDIVNVKLSNEQLLDATFDHPMYSENGELVSYNPSRTMEWYNGEVKQLEVGTKLKTIDGTTEVVEIVENIVDIQTYTLFVKDNKNFYANGVLIYDEEK